MIERERVSAVVHRFGGPAARGPLFSERYAMALMPVPLQYLHWALRRRLSDHRSLWPVLRLYRRVVVRPLTHRAMR